MNRIGIFMALLATAACGGQERSSLESSAARTPPSAVASAPAPESSASGEDDGSRWVLATGKFRGHLLIMRYRSDLGAFPQRASYPEKFVVTWHYGGEDPNGMPPDDAALDALEQFEIRLFRALEKDGGALAVAVATTNGEREWIFYSGDSARAEKAVNDEFSRDPQKYPLKMVAVRDPEWSEYRGIVANARAKPLD